MGCSSSKQHSLISDGNAPFSHSTPLPMHGASGEEGTSSKVSWNSFEADCLVNDVCERSVGGSYEAENHHIQMCSELQPKKGYISAATSKLPLSNGSFRALPKEREESKRLVRFHKSASSSPAREVTDKRRLSLWDNRPRSVNVVPTSNTLSYGDSRVSSFRCMEPEDGLRLLLSPVTTPSRSITASSTLGKYGTALSCNGRLNGSSNDDFDFPPSPKSAKEGTGDSEEPGSPLFDPSILATFEKAIEASSEESWQQISEVSTNSSCMVASASLDACSDAGSPNWLEERSDIRESSCEDEKPSMMSTSKAESKFAEMKQDYIDNFERKCPPACEDKVVLYFTSLRGVRKTYENCGLVRLILKGYGVHVDERDTWMHSKFREELTHVMGTVTSVPRLFIKGRYIGGAEEVKCLHEDGLLEVLLEGLPVNFENACDVCGGVRFVPCSSCSGSCKMISIGEISRCPDCNENGLILCPSCGL